MTLTIIFFIAPILLWISSMIGLGYLAKKIRRVRHQHAQIIRLADLMKPSVRFVTFVGTTRDVPGTSVTELQDRADKIASKLAIDLDAYNQWVSQK